MDSLFVVGGIVSSLNYLFGFVAVVTAAAASTARYIIVLTNPNRHRLERATAYGFHVGIVAALALFAVDQALG